jgi:hypothetical protein
MTFNTICETSLQLTITCDVLDQAQEHIIKLQLDTLFKEKTRQ